MKENMSASSVSASSSPHVGIVIGQLSHGGAEKQTAILAEGLLHTSELLPVVFCLSNSTEPHGDALRAAGVPLHTAPEGLKPGLQKLRWLAKQIRKVRCELIYGALHIGNIYAGVAALTARLPLITSIRNADEDLSPTIRALSGYFCRRSACVIANSPSCIISLREDLGVRHQRVRLIPNAVPSAAATPGARTRLRREFGIPAEAVLIGTVALLKPQKRPEFFIEICRELYRREPASPPSPLHFIWIGDGPEKYRITAMLAALTTDLSGRIHFTGACTDVPDCLAAMDIFILTSAYEGMPNALMEAMAAGLPCLATDVAGIRDVITGAPKGMEIGVLSSADDPKTFATQLMTLLQDPDRMHAMRAVARSHIREVYTPEKMIQAYQEVFIQALAYPRPSRRRL